MAATHYAYPAFSEPEWQIIDSKITTKNEVLSEIKLQNAPNILFLRNLISL